MKLYEKILIAICIVGFILSTFRFENSNLFFQIFTAILALSYLIAGYWLFNTTKPRKKLIPIISGVVFCISLFVLPYFIRIDHPSIYWTFPNLALSIFLSIYWFLNRKSESQIQFIKPIFFRSLVILLLLSFFAYLPISFKPYRKVVYVLNAGLPLIQSNILMFDYNEKSEKALKEGNYNEAIEYAFEANKAGKIWLELNPDKEINIDSNSFLNLTELWKIEGTYSAIYNAYTKRGDKIYAQGKYKEALLTYEQAYYYLRIGKYSLQNTTIYLSALNYWNEEEPWSLRNIAACYKNLNEYRIADSFFSKAIDNYKNVKGIEDNGLADLYSAKAFSLSFEMRENPSDLLFSQSNELFEMSNNILLKDPSNKKNRSELASNYNGLAKNHLDRNNIETALNYIFKAFSFVDNEETYQMVVNYANCLVKLGQISEANTFVESYLQKELKQKEQNKQTIREYNFFLGLTEIYLAKYDDARKHFDVAAKMILIIDGANSISYADCIRSLATLNKIVGDYTIAEKQYKEALDIYFSKYQIKWPTILAPLANLEVTLSNFSLAKEYADAALSISSNSPYPNGNTLNDIAFVNYALGLYSKSETLYKQVLNNTDSSLESAIALNGIGLLETGKKNYTTADSLFTQSLKIHLAIFPKSNPSTATVYLNLANLYILQNKLKEAETNLNLSLNINKQLFKNDHDVFGDIYLAFGDLTKKTKQAETAKDYYQKAYQIYLHKFDEKHWKVLFAKKKMQ